MNEDCIDEFIRAIKHTKIVATCFSISNITPESFSNRNRLGSATFVATVTQDWKFLRILGDFNWNVELGANWSDEEIAPKIEYKE